MPLQGLTHGFWPRILKTIVVLALVLLAVLAGAGAFLTYSIVTTRNDTENVTPSSYLLSSYETVNFTDRHGAEHEGWLLRGLRGAPVIILNHGFNSNRSELLSLGILLRENHFTVYLFNEQGPGSRVRYSDLGVRRAEDLWDAIGVITKQAGVNPRRVGLFGVTTGGYASLAAALENSQVKALAVDTIYENPDQMFLTQLDQMLGGAGSFFQLVARTEFHLLLFGKHPPPIREKLARLENVQKLFIASQDFPALAEATKELYNEAPPPKRLLVLDHTQAGSAAGPEKKEYDSQVVNFFLQALPLRAD
jgi:pimeloyl-ACP methyl ester carboxylesterase